MDRVVAAFLAADCVWAADVTCFGVQTVIAAFAIRAADRVNRRKIQHVESQIADSRHLPDDIVQSAGARRIICDRTRKHFVPAGEHRLRPIGVDGHRFRQLRQEWAMAGRLHRSVCFLRKKRRRIGPVRCMLQHVARRGRCLHRDATQQGDAFLNIRR